MKMETTIISILGFWGLGLRLWGLGFRVWGLRFCKVFPPQCTSLQHLQRCQSPKMWGGWSVGAISLRFMWKGRSTLT